MDERETVLPAPAPRSLPAALSNPTQTLTEEDARRIYQQGEEAVIFVLPTLAKERAELAQKLAAQKNPSPATPSAMVPVYQKPPTHGRAKKPGRPDGHEGVRRPAPPRIDRREEHRLECCPDCGGDVTPIDTPPRTRVVEDILYPFTGGEKPRRHQDTKRAPSPHAQFDFTLVAPVA